MVKFVFHAPDGRTGIGRGSWQAIRDCLGPAANELPAMRHPQWEYLPRNDSGIVRRAVVELADGSIIGRLEELES